MKDLTHQDLDTVAITYGTLEAVCATPMVPKAFQGNPHAALAAVLLGREIGLGPMTSLQQIDVIDSKPALSSEPMVSLVRRVGHSVTVPSWSADACTVRGVRTDNGDTVEVTFTMDDAAKAGRQTSRTGSTIPSRCCTPGQHLSSSGHCSQIACLQSTRTRHKTLTTRLLHRQNR